jgi:hypothetical protein
VDNKRTITNFLPVISIRISLNPPLPETHPFPKSPYPKSILIPHSYFIPKPPYPDSLQNSKMKRFFVSGFAILILSTETHSQLCPGGGTTFSTSVTFLQSWTSGCSGTTSCTGGIVLDNRSTCEPSTVMDPCAPTPSGTIPADNGSDLWFKFYATGTTAAIHVKQSVSFMAAVQAFSGGPTCGALTEIGSIVASGISVGVTLNLSSLTTGNAYYFRVFGSSSNSSQRTGTFCFCGSTGLG